MNRDVQGILRSQIVLHEVKEIAVSGRAAEDNQCPGVESFGQGSLDEQ